jgi:hypothetical protein
MNSRVLRGAIVLAVCVAAWSAFPCGSQQAYAAGPRTSPDLFYNYYVPPGPCGTVGAQLYLSPLPTPPLVGHTYFTYQPLMPHEFLYQHSRTYNRFHPRGGWTRSMVIWQ